MANNQQDWGAVFSEAWDAASAAMKAHLSAYGEGMVNCGFAWVDVKPARGPFINWCKQQEGASYGGKKNYGGGGWQFWGPGNWPSSEEMGCRVYGQDKDVKYAGAAAFAEVLRKYGIDARAGSRLD